ncbi:MAG: polysaccharide pyruvyl transferase family protein [Ruminococcus sp.]
MINNYGALEQTYALNKYLRLNGIDAKTIDFRTYRVKESYQLFHPVHSAMDFIRNAQALLYSRKLKRRNFRFHQFLKDNVPMTEEAYYSNSELQKADFDFDYYICGSDQVWNTYCQNYDDAFILSFAKDKGERLSYAASMGKDDINPSLREKFSEELGEYKAISVRESNAVSVIGELSKQPVVHVVDPVFLLDSEKWDEIAAENPVGKPYIFFYNVKGDIPGMRDYVRNLKKATGLPIVVVNCNLREMKYKNIKCYDAGPAEFVSLVKNAEYIVTNSFHASAFSIIFRKKFIVFNDKANGTSRISSLLNLCGVSKRQATKDSDVRDIFENIDYESVYKNLMPMIEQSKDFLAATMEYERRY